MKLINVFFIHMHTNPKLRRGGGFDEVFAKLRENQHLLKLPKLY